MKPSNSTPEPRAVNANATAASAAANYRPVVVPSPLNPVEAAVQALNDVRIKHTRIGQMMRDLHTLTDPPSPDEMMLICGPTGVGKSTLARYVVGEMMGANAVQMNENAGLIPALYVNASASGEHDFSWRLFFNRILEQLDGDTAMPKHNYGIDPRTGRLVRPMGPSSNSLAALRTSVERALRERGTQHIVIDEAAHIIRQAHRGKLEGHLDTLKSLANESGTQMVLIGSYDLYQLMSLSGQLARRTHVMHFDRYRVDKDEDVRAFRACVQKFENALPALWGHKLTAHSDALHQNTMGCIGTLSAVLKRAARFMAAGDGWSASCLQRGFLTDAQHKRILEEILDGEEAINPGLTYTVAKRGTASRSDSKSKIA
mgnify:CR=1 FL=1